MQVEVKGKSIIFPNIRMKQLLAFVLLPLVIHAVRWPLGAGDEPRPIGNSWGEIQTYHDVFLYLHPGVDVMAMTIGEPVYAVAPGIVKSWLTIDEDWHWRLAIADSATADSCDGWLYAHIDPYREHKQEGDWVEEGDLIGYLVEWGWGFEHLHWARIRGAGQTWSPDWLFVDNPSVDLVPSGDTVAPIFENAVARELLGFRPDNASPGVQYLSSDSLFGDVDIIARIHDKTGEAWFADHDTVWERLVPMEAWFEIHGERSIGPVRAFLFDGYLHYEENITVLYSRDFTCFTFGDWLIRDYYFILTNTDGDSLREESDYDSCWHTRDFPNGNYRVVVTAKDAAGNTSVDSMQVRVANITGVAESDPVKSDFELLTPIVKKGTSLSLVSSNEKSCWIYDVTGRMQRTADLQSSSNPQEIGIPELPRGVYYLRVQGISSSYKFTVIQ